MKNSENSELLRNTSSQVDYSCTHFLNCNSYGQKDWRRDLLDHEAKGGVECRKKFEVGNNTAVLKPADVVPFISHCRLIPSLYWQKQTPSLMKLPPSPGSLFNWCVSSAWFAIQLHACLNQFSKDSNVQIIQELQDPPFSNDTAHASLNWAWNNSRKLWRRSVTV